MMNPEVKAKWVAALRSGKYGQIKSQLTDGGSRFCCLGVLCEISKVGEWATDEIDGEVTYGAGGESDSGLPPIAVADWAGFPVIEKHGGKSMNHLRARVPVVTIGDFTTGVDSHNDSGHTFAEIADAIEEQL